MPLSLLSYPHGVVEVSLALYQRTFRVISRTFGESIHALVAPVYLSIYTDAIPLIGNLSISSFYEHQSAGK